MKIVVRGRYGRIDTLLREIRLANRTTQMVIEYPEAYYHSKENWKGTVVAYTDCLYLNFSVAGDRRFRNLDVCVTGARYLWSKPPGTCRICCTDLHSEDPLAVVLTEPEDEPSDLLGSYETLDLWEKRVSGSKL